MRFTLFNTAFMVLSITIASVLIGGCCPAESIPHEYSVVRFLDPTNNAPNWIWKKNKVLHVDPTVQRKDGATVGLNRIWRRSKIVNSKLDYSLDLNIPCDGVLEFASHGAVCTGEQHSGTVILDVSVTHKNSTLTKEFTLPITDCDLAHWEEIRMPLIDIRGSVKVTFSRKSDGPDVHGSNVNIFVATPMFVPVRTEQKPNVILWAFDSLRADEVGAYGSPLGNTPTLDSLSKQGIVFTQAISTASWTLPGVKNMLAGMVTHQYIHENQKIRDCKEFEIPLIQSEYARAGYMTIAISSNHLLCSETGIEAGFDVLDSSASFHWTSGSSNELYRALTEAFKKYSDRPLFIYIHAMDPHDPYLPYRPFDLMCDAPGDDQVNSDFHDRSTGKYNLEPYRSTALPLTDLENNYLRSYYRGEIRQMDSYYLAFLSLIESCGLFDNTLFVVTADHGEEFGKHGTYQHGMNLYEGVLRIPLILCGKGVAENNILQPGLVSNMDIPQTLLSITGNQSNPLFEGLSLYPLSRGKIQNRYMFAVSRAKDDESVPRWRYRSIYRGNRKLMWQSGPIIRMFDLGLRPDESGYKEFSSWEEYYSTQKGKTWQSLGLELQEYMGRIEEHQVTMKMKPELEAQLRELGYIK